MDKEKKKHSTTDADLQELLSTNIIEEDKLKIYHKYLIKSFRMVNTTKKSLVAVIELNKNDSRSLFLPDHVKQKMPKNILQKLESGEEVEVPQKFCIKNIGKTASGDMNYEFAF